MKLMPTFGPLSGHVPGPIIFSAIFDSSCLVWQEKCDQKGSCWTYDSSALSWGMSWVVFTASGVNAICWSISLVLYKPPDHRKNPQVGVGSNTEPVKPKPETEMPIPRKSSGAGGNADCGERETEPPRHGLRGCINGGLTNDGDLNTRM